MRLLHRRIPWVPIAHTIFSSHFMILCSNETDGRFWFIRNSNTFSTAVGECIQNIRLSAVDRCCHFWWIFISNIFFLRYELTRMHNAFECNLNLWIVWVGNGRDAIEWAKYARLHSRMVSFRGICNSCHGVKGSFDHCNLRAVHKSN